MAWEIDRFGVKPSGFLANWRYIRIMVDENGIISVEDVPGEPSINLDRISDYKKNDRRYQPGQEITRFCNRDTFTKFIVTASNERPFAFTTTELNSPDCGYQTPTPEPAVPYNPFGNPVYAPYRTFDFCDYEYNNVNVLIEKKNYVGAVMPIELGDASPVILRYKEVDNKYDPIRPLECDLNFVVTENFSLQEFYTEDERTFRVTVTKNEGIKFRGYIIPDSCNEPFEAPPYPVSIKCTDSIGSLKTVTYPLPIGQTFDLKQSFINIIAYCFAPTNLNLDIATICNLYETTMPTGLGDDPFDLASINPLRLADDKGTTLTSYDVLSAIATAWSAYVVQVDGVWTIVRYNELANTIIPKRTYNYKGLRLRSENIQTKRVIGGSLPTT